MKGLKHTDWIAIALIILFTYTAASKFANLELFSKEIHNQPFGKTLADILIWAVPSLEMITSALLLFYSTRKLGFWFSLALMLVFTSYVSFVLLGGFDRIPCSCGGIIKSLSWEVHLVINIIFLLLALTGLLIERKPS